MSASFTESELKNAADEDANLPRLRVQFIPGQPLLERFETMVKLLAEKTHRLEQQSRTLVALRDALLPGLISGELRIRGAERFMERVGA